MAEKAATTGFLGSLENAKWDLWLATATVGLVVFGLVMIYSASGYIAQERFGNANYFLTRQGVWVLLGFAVMLVVMRIDYLHYWQWSFSFRRATAHTGGFPSARCPRSRQNWPSWR
jgi:cell division protein FtsW (lipid II flippase)